MGKERERKVVAAVEYLTFRVNKYQPKHLFFPRVVLAAHGKVQDVSITRERKEKHLSLAKTEKTMIQCGEDGGE